MPNIKAAAHFARLLRFFKEKRARIEGFILLSLLFSYNWFGLSPLAFVKAMLD